LLKKKESVKWKKKSTGTPNDMLISYVVYSSYTVMCPYWFSYSLVRNVCSTMKSLFCYEKSLVLLTRKGSIERLWNWRKSIIHFLLTLGDGKKKDQWLFITTQVIFHFDEDTETFYPHCTYSTRSFVHWRMNPSIKCHVHKNHFNIYMNESFQYFIILML